MGIVNRLRRNSGWRNAHWQCVTDPALLTEAADRIEALEAENERLRSTSLTDVELEAACHAVGIFLYGPDAERFEKMFDAAMTARTALERIDHD